MNAYLIIIDGLGIGAMADAVAFDSARADTFAQIESLCDLPNLRRLGFYNIFGVGGDAGDVVGGYARSRQISNKSGFDVGYAEILGNINFEHSLYAKRKDKEAENYSLINLAEDNGVSVKFVTNNLDDCFDNINSLNIIRRTDLTDSETNSDAFKAAEALASIDGVVGRVTEKMESSDLLIIVGNGGISLDGMAAHRREYSPFIIYLPKYAVGADMGTVHGLDTAAMTIAEYFGIYTSVKSKLSAVKILPKKTKTRLPSIKNNKT